MRRLVLVNPPAPAEVPLQQQCVEGMVRACVQRRAQLRRDLAAEEARLTWLRRRLADQRGLTVLRVEALEREFL